MMTGMALGLLIQLLPLVLIIWVIRAVWRKGREDSGRNSRQPYSQQSRPSRSGQARQAYGQAARNRQAWQAYGRQSMPGQNRQAWQAYGRQSMPGQNRQAQQAYSRQNMPGQNRQARQTNSRQNVPDPNRAAQQAYARQIRNGADMRGEAPEGSELMDKVYDLMVTGYSGDLKFERDFLAEGMDMLSSELYRSYFAK